jgi:hypothetical protein
MSSTLNLTQYTYSSGASGTTTDGTAYSVNLNIEVQSGTDFTDATSWTLFDALLTALGAVGWTVSATDISLSKLVLDDTSYNGDPTTKTFP